MYQLPFPAQVQPPVVPLHEDQVEEAQEQEGRVEGGQEPLPPQREVLSIAILNFVNPLDVVHPEPGCQSMAKIQRNPCTVVR